MNVICPICERGLSIPAMIDSDDIEQEHEKECVCGSIIIMRQYEGNNGNIIVTYKEHYRNAVTIGHEADIIP